MTAPGRPGSALVIGEALVDVVIHPGQEPVDIPGGAPANVALGLARLGRDVELHCWIGTDERGQAVRSHLEASGVQYSASATAPVGVETVDMSGMMSQTLENLANNSWSFGAFTVYGGKPVGFSYRIQKGQLSEYITGVEVSIGEKMCIRDSFMALIGGKNLHSLFTVSIIETINDQSEAVVYRESICFFTIGQGE